MTWSRFLIIYNNLIAIKPYSIFDSTHRACVVRPRDVALKYMRDSGLTLKEISEAFNDAGGWQMHHTTILHSVTVANDEILLYKETKRLYEVAKEAYRLNNDDCEHLGHS